MKKLVTAACALVAASAFAVESANIVGYEKSEGSDLGFNYVAPAFATVGQNTATYGDIVLEGGEEYSDVIQILDENGDLAAMYYWTDSGWFDMDGYADGGLMTDEAITRGASLIVDVESQTSVNIVVSGEVATNAIEFAAANTAVGFNWVGNPFPTAITFGAITLVGGEEYSDVVQILDENGDLAAMYYWTNSGWFDMDGYADGGMMTDEPIPAGTGIIVDIESGEEVGIRIAGINF